MSEIKSAYGNNCGICQYRHNPQGGHCYMFKNEPVLCRYLKQKDVKPTRSSTGINLVLSLAALDSLVD